MLQLRSPFPLPSPSPHPLRVCHWHCGCLAISICSCLFQSHSHVARPRLPAFVSLTKWHKNMGLTGNGCIICANCAVAAAASATVAVAASVPQFSGSVSGTGSARVVELIEYYKLFRDHGLEPVPSSLAFSTDPGLKLMALLICICSLSLCVCMCV